ncbi:Zn-dependent peptidase ImmA (M78 family)/transcriptional regulator with XRE-family HTH domain [Saccharothrix coeruleofusca]|uniref:helix-turn-helix domain-containing protein n=1 Tax=Saccharothrix coeruleofusca TaxID=33919 RepID=UPI001FD3DE0B|nr:XRE family transcriptional regulator [Saccharothrix coeruleofusca]MBP2334012.1 Zn-dependent peptidase ImmA (M78 family)/transcriptional regulator with XRE-family HTH domain [Saccharothrix coeruleofusca]
MEPQVGALIERARIVAGFSQRALADATGISQSTLSRIISGDRAAKMPEVVAIAWATGHTVAQLTGVGAVADRAQCVARATRDSGMEHMREALLHFLELNDYLDDQAVPAIVRDGRGALSAETEGRAAAERFRQEHHLGTQPLGDLVALIEQTTGIDVAVLDAGPDEHGLTMRDPTRGAVFIGVARTQNPMRQRSTLAHELGHVLFQDWRDSTAGNWSERTPAEVRADDFARHLLVPIDGLREFLGARETITRSDLSAIVQRFLVSPAIAAIALHQAEYIDTATKQEWMALSAPHLAIRFGWGDQYRALQVESDQRRAPQRLLARAIRGYVEGVLPVQAIATLRGVESAVVEADLGEAGVVPVERPVVWADPAELPDVHVDLEALDEALDALDGDPPDVRDAG